MRRKKKTFPGWFFIIAIIGTMFQYWEITIIVLFILAVLALLRIYIKVDINPRVNGHDPARESISYSSAKVNPRPTPRKYKWKPDVNYDQLDGVSFEKYCVTILCGNGFTNVRTTSFSGDHGVDILAELNGEKYAIQCKCYSSNVSVDAVREALMGKWYTESDYGVVLTNSRFTVQAVDEAEKTGILLWSRPQLNRMVQNADVNYKRIVFADVLRQILEQKEDNTCTEQAIAQPQKRYTYIMKNEMMKSNK